MLRNPYPNVINATLSFFTSLPKVVLVSYDEFQALVRERAPGLSDLRADYDVLLARMQTPAAKRGMAAAFDATPAQMGRAAVSAATAARKRR